MERSKEFRFCKGVVVGMCENAKQLSDIMSPFNVGVYCQSKLKKPYSESLNPYLEGSDFNDQFQKGYLAKKYYNL